MNNNLVVSKAERELIVIIPAFNEEAAIGNFIDSLKDHGVFDYADVLVINDGSRDKTSFIARSKGAKVITHIYNLGYGCALQTGYKYAVRRGYKYLIQIDSDGQHDACNVKNLYDELKAGEGKSEIVIGSRFFETSKSFHISIFKKFAINLFKTTIKISTGKVIKDPTSGLQGLSRDAFLFCSYYDNFFPDYPDANMIIQMLLNNFIITEIPSVMHERKAGTSMHSGLKPILYIMKMIISTLCVIIREKSNGEKRKRILRKG